MLIYIVRHGETPANSLGYMQGQSNDPINENGRALAVITGQGLKGVTFDECISSPLIRAKETAEILLRESGNENVPISIDERLMEINLGDWERKKFRPGEREVDEEQIRIFFTDPFNFEKRPGGESIREVCDRTQEFLKELLARDDDKTYLITTHGFALRGMLNFLYEDQSDYWHGHVPYNCAVNIIEGKNGIGRLIADDRIYYDMDDAVDQYAKF
ncbi:MAG: histidine phosphatase family protein [Mogibacterium sp.]|nr:histidine phosphatase family protein [Mogibacterium sp.]